MYSLFILVLTGYGAVPTMHHTIQEKRESFDCVYISLPEEKRLLLRKHIDIALQKRNHGLCIENKDKSRINKDSFFYNPNITQDNLVNIYINGEVKTKCTLQECKEFCEAIGGTPMSEEHL